MLIMARSLSNHNLYQVNAQMHVNYKNGYLLIVITVFRYLQKL